MLPKRIRVYRKKSLSVIKSQRKTCFCAIKYIEVHITEYNWNFDKTSTADLEKGVAPGILCVQILDHTRSLKLDLLQSIYHLTIENNILVPLLKIICMSYNYIQI